MKSWKSKLLGCLVTTIGMVMFFIKLSIAQTVPLPKFESPNTASLGKYGDVPVSYFTGVPDISFPLYNINVGNINVPISLSYHPNSVKPNEHPGWTGLGWNLNAYGKITRVKKGSLDELNIQSPTSYPYFPDQTYHGTNNGASFINTSDWDSPTRIGTAVSLQPGSPSSDYDVSADEFSFNFGAYSGTFYYSANGWQVVSENTNIKVQELGFMNNSEINLNIVAYEPQVPINGNQSRMFRGFILTTEDGTKYTFGYKDLNNDPNCGVEFWAQYATLQQAVVASSWLLRKIEDINGQVVTFDYQKKAPTCAMSFYTSQTSYSCYYDWSQASAWANGPVNTNLHSGVLLYPVYLKKITSSKEIIDFTISETTELKYSDRFLRYAADDFGGTAGLVEFPITALANDVVNLRWYKLDDITISNTTNQVVKKIHFDFSNVPMQRLTLNYFTERDRSANDVKKYQFGHGNEPGVPNHGVITDLPDYGGDKTDHWGFYNSSTSLHNQSFANLPVARATNAALITTGLLSSITYPTGGKTVYVWEANKSASVVSVDRQSLTPFTPGFVGGCRIKEIRNYADPAGTPLTTKYFYVKNFSAGVDPATLTSSGILNGTPKYYFNIPSRLGIGGVSKIAYLLESVNSLVSYSYNGSSSHVGYSEVVEQKPDNSYSKYYFTNFDLDINGQTHWDKIPGVIGWQISPTNTEDAYVTMSSLQLERGKPLMTSSYRNDNVLLQKTNLYYRTDAGRFNDFLKMYDIRNSFGCQAYDALILASAYKAFKYNYYVVKEVKTNYDINGANPVITTSDYEYNLTNQLSKSTTTVSSGRKLITRYLYPSDFTIITAPTFEVLALQSMKTKNIISTPVEAQTIQEVNAVQTLLKGTVIKFKDYGGGLIKPAEALETELLVPSTVLTQCSVNASNQFVYNTAYKSKILYDSYETNGGITQYHKKDNINNSFIYDYQTNYPIAEVINASLSEIAYTSFEANGKGNWTFSGASATDATAPTGKKVYNLSGGNITKAGLNTLTTYIISYWRPVGSSALTISGTITGYPVSGRTANGWTYYEHRVSAITTATLAGTGMIDEVRLYPSVAQMTTYTYSPLVGLINKSDANNRIVNYEYDGFGRLVLVRDQDKNILEKNCYNYKDQLENCNIYYNNEAVGSFTKAGCPSCTTASSFIYSVPANLYLSTNSQAEADALAQNEVALNGQNFANQNGVCVANAPSAINSYNSTTTSVSVTLFNTTTFTNYYYTVTTGSNSQPPSIPCGIYNVSMSPSNSGTYSYYINGYSIRTSNSVSFSNISLSGGIFISIGN
ncbi:MAG: DUF5977 domain-containing protein [Ferruginibacter sp.]